MYILANCRVTVLFFALFFIWFSNANAFDIQLEINLKAAEGGGVVHVPLGAHPGPPIEAKSNVILKGEGWGTVIPNISASPERIYGFELHNLMIDGHIADGGNSYGIDWRDITNGSVTNVLARNVDYGLILTGAAYYNTFKNLFVDAAITGVELSGNANQNTFIGGKFAAPICLHAIGDANGNSFVGTSLEVPLPLSQVEFYKTTGLGAGAGWSFQGVRRECSDYGPTWLNGY